MKKKLKNIVKEVLIPISLGTVFLIAYYWKGAEGIQILYFILITAIYLLLINRINKYTDEEMLKDFCQLCTDIKGFVSFIIIILYIATIILLIPLGEQLQRLGITLAITVAIIIGLPTACQYHCPKQQNRNTNS